MNDYAAEVWKNRALDAENALKVALIELTKSRGTELVLRAALQQLEESS